MLFANLIGYPRIGPQRELKWVLESAWSGRLDRSGLDARVAELRAAHLDEQRGLIGSAVDDFFLYDEVLETALMLGVVPEALRDGLRDDPFGVLSALARGTPEREAWEMTKWFDTNYHYVVPEIADSAFARLTPLPWRQPMADDPGVAWAVLGPYSLLRLSRFAASGPSVETAAALGEAYWHFVRERADADSAFHLQLDEPCLGLTMDATDEALRDAAYGSANRLGISEPAIVTVQFGKPSESTLVALGRRGLAVQVPLELAEAVSGGEGWRAQPEHVLSVMDGRGVWPDDFARARAGLEALPDDGKPVRLVPSTSLMFLPYTVAGEDVPDGFQFAREKARSLAGWLDALEMGEAPAAVEPPRVEWAPVGEIRARTPRSERRAAQADLALPAYPTTSIGSLPQTAEVRQLRVRLRSGAIVREEYDAEMSRLITEAIGWQERKGIDVLVHGEFERTDMVEYFAEQLDGYLTTRNGWVLSYGSRCVRPPILAAPPVARGPMTVREWRVAQSATAKPVKGMLTGPVTIVNWSFRPPGVPDDRLFWAVAQPVAAEVRALVDAGARVIQVDEPAVRERWPLPTEGAEERREVYARGVRASLSHVFDQPAHVQLHTHMCYGTDASIARLWEGVGVDAASIWYARAPDDERIRAFYASSGDGHLQIGPGVFDVHSPHTPGSSAMRERLELFRGFMADDDLWVNPDCGLKTRTWDEIERQLSDMVDAARSLRATAEG